MQKEHTYALHGLRSGGWAYILLSSDNKIFTRLKTVKEVIETLLQTIFKHF